MDKKIGTKQISVYQMLCLYAEVGLKRRQMASNEVKTRKQYKYTRKVEKLNKTRKK